MKLEVGKMMEIILNDTFRIAMQKYSAKLYETAREGYAHVTTDGLFGQAAHTFIADKQKNAAFWSYQAWLRRTELYSLGGLEVLSILPHSGQAQ